LGEKKRLAWYPREVRVQWGGREKWTVRGNTKIKWFKKGTKKRLPRKFSGRKQQTKKPIKSGPGERKKGWEVERDRGEGGFT